ncbi:hypothetical protein V6O07_23635, partial [Arthrospira platensis SPKY2]
KSKYNETSSIKYHITDNVISLILNKKEVIITKKLRPDIFNNLKNSLIQNEKKITEEIINELSNTKWIEELNYILDEDKDGNLTIKGRNLSSEETFILNKIHYLIKRDYGPWGIKPLLSFFNNVEKNNDIEIKRNIYRSFINKEFSITNEGYIIAYRRAKWQIYEIEKLNLDSEILGWNTDLKFGKIYKSQNNKDCILGSFNAVTESFICLDEGEVYENAVNPEHINKFIILNKKGEENKTAFYLETKQFFPIGKMKTYPQENHKIWKIDLNCEDREHYLIRTPYNKDTAIKELTNLFEENIPISKKIEPKDILISNC